MQREYRGFTSQQVGRLLWALTSSALSHQSNISRAYTDLRRRRRSGGWKGSYKIHIIRTGQESHFSKAILFARIDNDLSTARQVTTDLPTAMRFIQELDDEEAAANPEWRAPRQLDAKLGDDFDGEARGWGYQGPPVAGSSTTWQTDDPYWRRNVCLPPLDHLIQSGLCRAPPSSV